MSDNSQTIVDLEVRAEEAARLGTEILDWLVREGIVAANPSDCVLGEGHGYAPGPRFLDALENPAAGKTILRLAPNGLRIAVGRQLFDSGGNGIELMCGACGTTFEPGPGWADAVADWSDGNDAAAFSCPSCDRSQRLAAWRGPWAWGFGNLGLEFWNWPPLSDSFVRSVERRLGHSTVLVRCHL